MKSLLIAADDVASRFRGAAWAAITLAIVILVSSSGSARAQTTGEKGASIAQALFDEGRALMDAQRFDEACAKLAESQRIDPASGTLLNLAVCHEKQGKTATAWAEYNDLDGLCRKEGNIGRQRIAAQRVHALAPTLPRITITPAPRDLGLDLAIKVDGSEIGKAALGVAIPLDPGEHVIALSAPGKRSWSTSVGPLAAGARLVVQVPPLERAAVEVSRGPALSEPPPQPQAWPAGNRRRRGALVSAALSLVGLGAAGYFGHAAQSEVAVRNAHCSPDCDPQGAAAGRSASRFALFADISAGAALLAGGAAVYLYLTPGATTAGPVAFRQPTGLMMTYQAGF